MDGSTCRAIADEADRVHLLEDLIDSFKARLTVMIEARRLRPRQQFGEQLATTRLNETEPSHLQSNDPVTNQIIQVFADLHRSQSGTMILGARIRFSGVDREDERCIR
jgi:hypothetical protein